VITVKIEIAEEPSALRDVKHTNTLRINGVPMRGMSISDGVESGILAYSDNGDTRTYTWRLDDKEQTRERGSKWFSKRFRVRRFESLGETWYEVQEKTWFWPFWDTWTAPTYEGSEPVRYPTLYMAKRAVSFYVRGEEPVNSVITHL